jgi:hypothetical protein
VILAGLAALCWGAATVMSKGALSSFRLALPLLGRINDLTIVSGAVSTWNRERDSRDATHFIEWRVDDPKPRRWD